MSTPTKQFIREDAPKILDLAIKIAFPILLGCSAWTFNTMWDHEGRLTHIESSRYTREDADKSLTEIRATLAKIELTLARREEILKGLDKSIDTLTEAVEKLSGSR